MPSCYGFVPLLANFSGLHLQWLAPTIAIETPLAIARITLGTDFRGTLRDKFVIMGSHNIYRRATTRLTCSTLASLGKRIIVVFRLTLPISKTYTKHSNHDNQNAINYLTILAHSVEHLRSISYHIMPIA